MCQSFFIRKRPDKIEIATFELKGVPFSDLLIKEQEKQEFLINRLTEIISSLHQRNFYHQDCYFNYFFWGEKMKLLIFRCFKSFSKSFFYH